jgi:hypothetical protein
MVALVGLLVASAGAMWWISARGPSEPLVAGDEPVLTVMDFSAPLSIEPPQAGWFHSTFWTRPPMTISQESIDGVAALRLETAASGSIFGRHTDVALRDFPTLTWSWRVETPIDASFDERTADGDDHAARLYLQFVDEDNTERSMEIIWSNGAFAPGEYKYIGEFAHYVAQSGSNELGVWVAEEVDLLRLYREVSGRNDNPRITMIAIFCDSDDTKTRSLAHFGNIELRQPGS